MDKTVAMKTGARQAFKAIVVGLIIAYLIMSLFSFNPTFPSALLYALSWIKDIDYKLNLFVGVVAMLIAGHFFGQRAGLDILIKKKSKYWTGIKYGLLIVWFATLVASLIGLSENIGMDDEVFHNYVIKPLYLVTFFGFIPIILVGLWFGYSIHDKAKTEQRM